MSGTPGPDGTAGADPSISLSSGSAMTGHGDFFNTWNQRTLKKLVRDCLINLQACPSPSTQ